ncbi:MAG TPA: hypothetical protein VN962_00360 [Polyangia bacterium]|nr:hypothetical protein [Polyangia bacterium]
MARLLLLVLFASACGSITTVGDGGPPGGSGGHLPGTGGAAGRFGGGTGGNSGTSCTQLESEYATELAKAKTCSPNASNQCQQTAPNALACGCETFVNDRSGLDQLQSRWNQAGCQGSTLCPAIACVMPRAASCRAGDGGGASCQDSLVATP